MLVIAGATGRVGGVAARALLGHNKTIRVIVRDAAKGAPWSALGAQLAVGNLGDSVFLTTALAGATGFFTLLPADLGSTDFYGDQRRMADSIATAVKQSGVPHVVLLSSHGADLYEGTGPVKCLHYLEEALHETSAQLTIVRAGYFQENVATTLAPAQNMGILPHFMLSADAPLRMIGTKDVGTLVARSLVDPPEKKEIVDIQGPTYSMRQVAQKLGAALGKELQTVDIPQAGWVDALTQAGLSGPIAEAFAEMYAALTTGKMVPRGDRLVHGATQIDEVIAGLVKGSGPERGIEQVVVRQTNSPDLPVAPPPGSARVGHRVTA